MQSSHSAIQRKTVVQPRTKSHIKRDDYGKFNSNNQTTLSQFESRRPLLCHQVTIIVYLLLSWGHGTEQCVIYSHEHYHNCFITLRKIQKRTGDPFSLKAQRKRSPCPIKRGTLKPSMLLATEPLILLHSLWQEKTFQTTLTRRLHKRY